MYSQLDRAIWKTFNFYHEEKWIPAAIPIAIFVIICLVLHSKEAKNAEKEEREINPVITIIYVIGVVVGIVELCAVLQALLLLGMFIQGVFFIIAIPMIIFSVVSIKRFVSDTDAAKKEGRHRKTNVKLMFIISIVFCFYLLTFLSRWFLVFI
ncbi:MAG: hypothetical protein K5795_07985 [Lachnospiraceae bacterium]|nr:hypothetical protein [Lachnospiraceae bacterium]